jgi:type II secretory pathway component GspD/PulD (secretin)
MVRNAMLAVVFLVVLSLVTQFASSGQQDASRASASTEAAKQVELEARIARLEKQVLGLIEQVKSMQKSAAATSGVATPDTNITSLTLRNAVAAEVVEIVKQMLGPFTNNARISIGSDSRTNVILVSGDPEVIAAIEALATRLDKPTADDRPIIRRAKYSR